MLPRDLGPIGRDFGPRNPTPEWAEPRKARGYRPIDLWSSVTLALMWAVSLGLCLVRHRGLWVLAAISLAAASGGVIRTLRVRQRAR